MDFNASPLDSLSQQLLKCLDDITTIFVFNFVVALLQHFAAILKLFTSEIIEFVVTFLLHFCLQNLSRQFPLDIKLLISGNFVAT